MIAFVAFVALFVLQRYSVLFIDDFTHYVA